MKRKAKIIGIILVMLGILDILLRMIYSSSGSKFYFFINDPGKAFFHLVVLPLVTWLFISNLSSDELNRMWQKAKPAFCLLPLLLLLAWNITYDDMIHAFNDRIPMPYEFSDLQTRDTLSKLHKNLNEHNYDPEIKQYIDIKNLHPINNFKDYWTETTFSSKSSFLLTFLSISICSFIIFTHVIIGWTNKSINQKQFNILLLMVSIISPWVFLRAYSEWFSNFQKIKETSLNNLILMSFVLSIILMISFVMHKRKTMGIILLTIVSASSSIVSFIIGLKVSYFNMVAHILYTMDFSFLLVIYSMLVIFFLVLIHFGIAEDKETYDLI